MNPETITLTKEEYESLLLKANKINHVANVVIEKHENIDHLETLTDNQITNCFESLENHESYINGAMGKSAYGEWCRKRDICILAGLTFMGLRPSECLTLKFSDINFESGYVHIDGQTNKQKKSRIVPLPNSFLKYLLDYLKQPRVLWNGSEYLFPSFEDRTKALTNGTWKRIMREKILKPCGYWLPSKTGVQTNVKFRSYSFRHYFAQKTLSKANGDINAVSQIMGHSNLNSTRKYLNYNEDYLSHLRGIMEK